MTANKREAIEEEIGMLLAGLYLLEGQMRMEGKLPSDTDMKALGALRAVLYTQTVIFVDDEEE